MKIYLPPPSNWQDFQSLVKSIATSRFDAATVVEYGRQGQAQDGVDVYAEDLFGKKIGIQCKETKGDLEEKVIRREADKARSFRTNLDLFIIATTAATDAKLQAAVIALNQSKSYAFRIRVEFWNDLVDDINRYAGALNGCYQSYKDTFQQKDEDRHLACLRIAFDRPAFKDDFLHERNYDDFEEALVTTKRLFRTGFGMDRWSQIPVVQTVPLEFLPEGKYRRSISKLEAKLEGLYRDYIADKQEIRLNHQYARERAGHYNILRRKLLTALNRQLTLAGLPEVLFSYR
jgi:hypothetical protein